MRTPMPPELRKQLQGEERMYSCALKDEDCSGHLQWHHAAVFAGRKLEVWWAIHAVCLYHHDIADRKDMRAKLVKLMHSLGGEEVKQFEKVKVL